MNHLLDPILANRYMSGQQRLSIKNSIFILLFFLCSWWIQPHAYAEEALSPGINPVIWLKQVSQSLLGSLEKLPPGNQRTLKQVSEIIEKKVLPYVDQDAVTRGVLARYYRKATPDQLTHFKKVFMQTLVWTYARVFMQYNGQKIRYFPLRDSWQDKKRIQINTEVQQTDRAPIEVYYRLSATNSGWEMYDLLVEGVSLVSSYQSQLSGALEQSGIDAVIDRLNQQNRAATAIAAKETS